MDASNGRRKPVRLSAETEWEIFLAITQGEVSQAEAARGWRVDVSVIIAIRRSVKDAALAALARKPGPQPKDRNFELEAAHDEVYHLTEAVKARAIELAILRGKAGWAGRCGSRESRRRGQATGARHC